LVAAAAWWKRREVNMTLVGLGIAFFLLPLLPSMVYRPAFTRIAYDYLDHRMFFPGIGLLLIAFAVLLPLVRERNWSVNYAYGLAAAMAVFAFVNARHYKNYTAYYDNATRTNPHSGLAWMNYGTMLARENRYPEMFQKFDRALEVIPENIELRMKLADSYYTVKDYARMEEQCRAVIAINPAFAKAYFNMALVRAEQKQTDAALQLMQTAVDKSPSNADAFYYRGLINKTLGRNDAALKDFQHTASLNPDHSNAYMEQGMLFGNMGRYADALAAADRYVQLNPSDGKGYFYRGQSRCLLNDKTNGCADLQRALSLGVPDAQAKIDYYCR
ncbi:MAG TPA: tetratricopeptide repeat protein, partial [Chitinophagales bacterium]|nr:tetratricopeptide repeat protein [Chitinophagales bacterium]